jgi:methionine biosynthesis protein MetW
MDYDEYWRVRGFHTLQPRYRIMAEVIEPGSTVLDLGCGEGMLLQYLAETRDTSGYGVDVSQEAVKLARERGIQAEVADITSWQIDQAYDYIILSEVLEHLVNPEEVISKVHRRFRKALIVSIPNIGYYPHRLRLLLGRFPLQWVLHPAEHLRYWTVTDFVEWIDQFGLQAVDVRSSNGFPILDRLWPNLFSNQVVFVIRPCAARGESG